MAKKKKQRSRKRSVEPGHLASSSGKTLRTYDVGALPGRLHAKSFAEQDFREVGIIPACIESLVLDTNFRC